MYELLSLFLSSFLAATLLPAQSEAVLALLEHQAKFATWLLVMVATFGNVLGALVNWVLGLYVHRFKDRKWFPVKETSLKQAEKLYEKWGVWTLLFAWLPFIGDPLTLVAGVFRVRIGVFLVLVTLGKGLRYIVVVGVVS